MSSALIVYASLTGNTEECADIVAESLEELGVKVTMVDSSQSDPQEYNNYDICIAASYTYGDGELPDEIVDFYEDLASVDLTGKVYGVFGSGDTYYDYFCKSVDDLDDQFARTGATRGAQSVKVNLMAEENDIENLKAFAASLVAATK